MFLAAEGATAAAAASTFDVFDIFVILFTVVIAWGVFRGITARQKNKFAIGFGVISLLVFLVMDYVMVMHWIGQA